MKVRALLSLVILLLVPSALLAEPRLDSTSAILDTIRERVDVGPEGVGIAVGLIDSTGTRFVSYGVTKAENGRDVDENTLFDVGSVTKVFTATVLSDMVRRGEVSLDDPISKYLPKSVRCPKRKGREITLIDLVTHTSGLPRVPGNMLFMIVANGDNPYADYTVDNLYEYLSTCSLSRDIGARYEYSNLGMALLAHVLALKAGTDYETLVRTRIWEPLGMKSTCIVIPPDLESRAAVGHDLTGRELPTWRMGVLEGAGAIRSTASDMTKFVAFNMGLMPTDLYPCMAATHEPRVDTDMHGLRVGMAWHILDLDGRPIVWHNGGTTGMHSFIGFDAAKRSGVVVLSNSANDIDDIGIRILSGAAPDAR
jgi:serine-type D-Ala-D-Ala carboxypeptidase/endopeptidase